MNLYACIYACQLNILGALLDNGTPPAGAALKYFDMNGRGNDVTAGQIVKLEFLVPFYHAVAEVGVLTIDLPGFLRADTKFCNERKSLVLSPWFERASWNVSTSVLAKSPDSTRWRPVSGRSNHDDVDQQVIQRVRVDSTIRPLRKGEVVTFLVHGLLQRHTMTRFK